MSANAYDRKTAAFAGFMLQHVPSLSNNEMSDWMDSPEALREVLAELTVHRRFLYKERMKIQIGAVDARKTADCISPSRFGHYTFVNSNLGEWPEEYQEATGQCTILVVTPCDDTPCERWVRGLLGLRNFQGKIGPLLLDRGYVLTLTQVEGLVERTEKLGAGFTGLAINSSTYFLTKVKAKINDGVALGKLVRLKHEWNLWIQTFGYPGEFKKHDQFLFPETVLS